MGSLLSICLHLRRVDLPYAFIVPRYMENEVLRIKPLEPSMSDDIFL